MDFKQFKAALGEETSQEDFEVDFTEVEQLKTEMFSDNDFYYFEMLGDNYHVEDLIGIAWEIAIQSTLLVMYRYCKKLYLKKLYQNLSKLMILKEVRSF